MKKTLLLLSLSLLVVWPALGADAPADHAGLTVDAQSLDAPSLDVQAHKPADGSAVKAATVELDADGLPLAVLDVVLRVAEHAYECPPNTAYCWVDAQCDVACGGSSAGACTFGCCRCAF